MPYTYNDDLDQREYEDHDVTCNRCGASVRWGNVWDALGVEKPALFDASGPRRHECKPSADDFQVIV